VVVCCFVSIFLFRCYDNNSLGLCLAFLHCALSACMWFWFRRRTGNYACSWQYRPTAPLVLTCIISEMIWIAAASLCLRTSNTIFHTAAIVQNWNIQLFTVLPVVCVKMRLRTFQFQKVFRGRPPPGHSSSTAYDRVPGRKRPGCWDLRALRIWTGYGPDVTRLLLYFIGISATCWFCHFRCIPYRHWTSCSFVH